MRVRDCMTTDVLTIGPAHTLQDAARLMAQRRVGAAVVIEPDAQQPGIITERDVLLAVAAGQDPGREPVEAHLTSEIVVADPEWPLHRAAAAMVEGGFRHLVVCEGDAVVGILSVRDVLRVWSREAGPVPA